MARGRFRQAAIALAAATLAPASALAQPWQNYAYADSGFSVQLPAAPAIQDGVFRTKAGQALPMKVYALAGDGARYTVKVVDFSTVDANKDAVIGEAEQALSAGGAVKIAMDARIDSNYGRELTIDEQGGGRETVALFFINHRFYQLIGEALPPNPTARSGDLVRFQQSLEFRVY